MDLIDEVEQIDEILQELTAEASQRNKGWQVAEHAEATPHGARLDGVAHAQEGGSARRCCGTASCKRISAVKSLHT